jgi:hypothetical protein
VGKNLGKFAGALAKCQMHAADSAFMGMTFDEAQCEADARSKYDAKNAKLTGCAPCILDAESVVAESVQSTFGSVASQTYCEDTTPIPF